MTDLYEETDEIRCPMCDTVHDASYDGSVPQDGVCDRVDLECGHCSTRFAAERLVIVRYRLVPTPGAQRRADGGVDVTFHPGVYARADGSMFEQHGDGSTLEISCDWDDCPPTESSPQTARSVYA